MWREGGVGNWRGGAAPSFWSPGPIRATPYFLLGAQSLPEGEQESRVVAASQLPNVKQNILSP